MDIENYLNNYELKVPKHISCEISYETEVEYK